MFAFLTRPDLLRFVGIGGSLVIFLSALIPGLVYVGKRGERYSVFNHFISELGERGVSSLAWVFNAGLICGGLIYLPYSLGLGFIVPGIWSKLGMLAGCVASISVALVGVFPMNDLTHHTRAAITYFRSGLLMVLFFSLAIWFQPADQVVLPKGLLWMGLLTAACFAAFLILLGRPSKGEQNSEETVLDPENIPSRPAFWLLPVLEWSIFASSILWFFVASLVL